MSVCIILRYGLASGVSEDLIGNVYRTLVVDEDDFFGLLAAFGDAMSKKLDIEYYYADV